MQEQKSDLVSASGVACFILLNRRQRRRSQGAGRRSGWDGVIPTKTWLRFVVIERKNVLTDRSFQPGHLEGPSNSGYPDS